MKFKLQTKLATIAPSISIKTLWSHDQDSGPISKECDGFDPSEDDEWQAWNSEVRATAIINGEEVSGSAYLGSTWEKYGDNPSESNPEISGYEPQMTEEALEELLSCIGKHDAESQIKAALKYVREVMESNYKAQMQAA